MWVPLTVIIICLAWSVGGPWLFSRCAKHRDLVGCEDSRSWADVVADWGGLEDPVAREYMRRSELDGATPAWIDQVIAGSGEAVAARPAARQQHRV